MSRWHRPRRRGRWTSGAVAACLALVVVAGIVGADAGEERPAATAVRTVVEARTVTGPASTSIEAPAPPLTPSAAPGSTVLTGEVTAVVDGDTIKVRSRGFETTVRLLGIDTPETRDPGRPVQCFGPEASERTARILAVGRRVRLETDPTQAERDRFGRLLAYVYRGSREGARGSVNYAFVATGHARAYVFGGTPFRYADAFASAERRAMARGLGLWGSPCDGRTDRPAPRPRSAGPPAPAPTPPSAPVRGSAPAPSASGYSPRLPAYPPDLDCADVDGPVQVTGSDPHGLDRDGDGVACE